MTDPEIDRLLALEEKATPEPWAFDTYNTVWAGSESNKNLVEICTIPDDPETGDSPKQSRDEWYPQSVGNAELISAARSALKPLALEVRRLRQERDTLAELLREAGAVVKLTATNWGYVHPARGGTIVLKGTDELMARIKAALEGL